MFDLLKWGRGKRLLGMQERQVAHKKRALELLTKPKVDQLYVKREAKPEKVDRSGKPYRKNGKLHVPETDYWQLVFHGRRENVYHSPFQNGLAFGAWLEMRGYRRIGSGAYSVIYHKPGSERVIKVSKRIDPWYEFVKWAYENGHKDWAPTVHSYKYFPGKDLPIQRDEKGNAIPRLDVDRGSPFYVAIVDKLQQEYNVPTPQNKFLLVGKIFDYAMRRDGLHPDIEAAAELLYPGLIKFSREFKEAFHKKGYSLDCYGNNTMLTIDGKRWVMNDPLCGQPKNDNVIKERYKIAA